MADLNTYASIAEIFGALTIICAGVFGFVQYTEYRRNRRDQVAAELCRRFAEPELAKAVILVKAIPEGATTEQIQALGHEYEAAAQIVGMSFETMGLLVYREIASFEIVQELCGGLLQEMWRTIGVWIQENRETHDNPRFGEWVQWLAERMTEAEGDITPAYTAHQHWKP